MTVQRVLQTQPLAQAVSRCGHEVVTFAGGREEILSARDRFFIIDGDSRRHFEHSSAPVAGRVTSCNPTTSSTEARAGDSVVVRKESGIIEVPCLDAAPVGSI